MHSAQRMLCSMLCARRYHRCCVVRKRRLVHVQLEECETRLSMDLTGGLGSTVPLSPALTRLAASSAQRAALSPRAWSDRPRSLGRASSDRPVQHSAHSPSHCAARLLWPSSGWLGQPRAASAGGAVGCMDRCDRSPCLALPLSVECAPFPLRTSYSASSSSPLQPQSAAVHAA